MTRTRTKIGDVFSVQLDDFHRKYFHYVADDSTQLNSYVIRVFKKLYPNDDPVDFAEVVKDEVDFYAHVSLNNGLKQGFWTKVGNVPEVGKVEVLFRNTNDWETQKSRCLKTGTCECDVTAATSVRQNSTFPLWTSYSDKGKVWAYVRVILLR